MDFQFTFEDLKEQSKAFKPDSTSSYFISYPKFIQYFKNVDNITEHELTIGAFFVYGWMPTILRNFTLKSTKECQKILNQSKRENTRLSIEDLEKLLPIINNSAVGLSKLLHFINPEVYPIWDSRVCRQLLKRKKAHSYQVNNIKNYCTYIELLNSFRNESGFKSIREQVSKKDLSDMRIIEMIIFEADRREHMKNK